MAFIYMTKSLDIFSYYPIWDIILIIIIDSGHLEEIAIESFGTDDLLKHIAHR